MLVTKIPSYHHHHPPTHPPKLYFAISQLPVVRFEHVRTLFDSTQSQESKSEISLCKGARQCAQLTSVFVFVKLKSVVTDSEVLTKSNKIKELMEVKIDTIRNYICIYGFRLILNIFSSFIVRNIFQLEQHQLSHNSGVQLMIEALSQSGGEGRIY